MPDENEKNQKNKIIMGMKMKENVAIWKQCTDIVAHVHDRDTFDIQTTPKRPECKGHAYCKTFLRSDGLNVRPVLITDGYLKHAEVTWVTI